MHRLGRVLVVMAGCVVLATPVLAGEKEHAAALQLVKLVVPRESFDQTIEQMTAGMVGQLQQSGEKLPADFETKMKAAVKEVLSYDEVLQWSAEIYAARFSVDEIKEIEKFYHTAVGKKLMKLLPELTGEVGKKIATVLPSRMLPAMKKHGLLPDEGKAEAQKPEGPATKP